ncbi:related to cAMP-dependent protein kinase regulatory subunit [Ramularia collo-cygni]|uniref:cAMP-dependent protein kinase regulatory subunit n=1 Tax=Ramularia collo-cygni TaxID=112498 RepID=A0A2D3VE53_9PEZI|nr:related to cAMP-dependent protein kinase regulatory subunit [Ramularia collo-cygni]CZT21104.1 related to cAMP-dependent protein kinase regulatory subunit [Ramularia collo-cygni]
MSLPSDYTNEIGTLNREVLKNAPKDILQFCANFFQRRLESQRAEFLLGQRHSTQPGIAESSFPGNNPFGTTSNAPGLTAGAMHSVAEEEEHDFASPTAANFAPHIRDPSSPSPRAPAAVPSNITTDNNTDNNTFGNFGNFGFGAGSGLGSGSGIATRSGDPSAAATAGAMDHTHMQSFPSNYNMNRRTSVSAESLAPAGADDQTWKAPQYPKTQDQISRLREAVAHNFLFSHLDDDQSAQVLGALQEKKVPAKDVRVIVQGDAGDYFYIVESGSFDIYVSKTGKVEHGANGMGNKVASPGPGSSFGELALMYNAPRAATVVSTEPSILWQLDRVTFRRILMDSAFQRRRMYESFLEEVQLFSSLTPYERSKIADALETHKYPAGSTIIREGDVGDKFYILECGEAEAIKRGREDRPLKQYKVGDYFGELALLDDKPRAASVLSKTEVKVATLGKDGFQRLLGPVESIMRRDDPRNADGSAMNTAR